VSNPTIEPDSFRELLAGHVLDDLSAEEQEFIDSHSWSDDDQQTLSELEATMARVQIAFQSDEEPMPKSLRSQIALDAEKYLVAEATSPPVQSEVEATNRDPNESPSVYQESRQVKPREVIAWLSCAAAVLLALGIWNFETSAPAPFSIAEMRRDLMAQAADLIEVPWSDGKHPFSNSVQGDVVWSNSKQTGFMRFERMPVNEPTREQYQLWIIDPLRDEEPIDGGVFDITANGEVIIPINAKLRVLEPSAFAITIEQPGGVVVSTQERLPLIAAVR